MSRRNGGRKAATPTTDAQAQCGRSDAEDEVEPEPEPDTDRARLGSATYASDVRHAVARLHRHEAGLQCRLAALTTGKAAGEIARLLGRLDGLGAGLATSLVAARSLVSTALAGPAETASELSGKVRALDLERARVEDTLRVAEQVAELKACVAGVVGSMGAPQDWEAAAGYVARAARVPEAIVRGGFAAAVVPTPEVPDAPWTTLESARESLCGLFLREFERAAREADNARVTRFFKLFPLIDRADAGLDVYGRYVCQGVAGTARAVLHDGSGGSAARRDGFFFAHALTKLFEHVALIVERHGASVERHYGPGKMVRVIERLQVEVDVQGGIILDSWTDQRGLEKWLTDVKSYPFSFLVQSFLPPQRGFAGAPHINPPAIGAGGAATEARRSEDNGLNMKDVDGLLSEIAAMLAKWSLYARFLAAKCKDAGSLGQPLSVPAVLARSNLSRKVTGKLVEPYKLMATFYFRRSVEKAFELDEMPAGLSLSMTKPVSANPPFIVSAVDDVMYIAHAVLDKSLSTSQRGLVDSVIATVASLLGSDFVGMVQRKMRDEFYPAAAVQGGIPPEDKVVAFVVLINSLDTAKEYLCRIVAGRVASPENSAPPAALQEAFPFASDAREVALRLHGLKTSFAAKTTELLSEGVQVLFSNVIRSRLRPVLADTFRDADYAEAELLTVAAELDPDERREQVARRFEHGWDGLMRPIARIMTARAYTSLVELTARYLARWLERRVLSLAGGKASALGIIRLERDVGAIAATVSKGHYGVREVFARTTQLLMVASIEEDEWQELVAGQADPQRDDGLDWVISADERRKARTLVRP